MRSFRLASGNDPIHLRQAARVERAVEGLTSDVRVVAVPVDAEDGPPAILEALGAALGSGAADAAVCPAGMMSAGLPPGVEVGAIFADSERAYRWVSCGRSGPGSLAHGATVVTWDDVSRAQILFRYPGLQVDSARGWTRVFSGLRQGIWGAACLPPEVVDAGSLWGLDTGLIAIDEVMPAIGQGSVALLTPRGGADPVVGRLNCPDRARRLRLESAFWWNVTDIPGTVVTASVGFEEGRVIVEGLVAEADGAWLVSDRGEADEAFAAAVVRDVADSCREMTWGRRARKEIAEHALHGRRAS